MLSNSGSRTFAGDVIFFVVIMILVLAGLVAIYSASHSGSSKLINDNFTRQFYFMMTGIFCAFMIAALPTRYLFVAAYWIYGVSLIFLLLALIMNHGAPIKRWIVLGSFRFQPSEVAKIGTLLALAKFLGDENRNLRRFGDVAIAFLIVGIPFILIYAEPDLGTSFVFISLVLPLLYWAGFPSFNAFVIIIPFLVMIAAFNFYTFFSFMILIVLLSFYFKRGLAVSVMLFGLSTAVGVVTPLIWNKLHAYQKHRILTFLGVEADPYGLSYQVIQSKVAIGSGGLLGKGFLNGTQTQLRFLPAQHTDFIFSVIGEEFGFLGSLFVLVLFLSLILRALYVSGVTRSRFLSLLSFGSMIVLGFHILVNIGMTVGIFPVTGLPLPFISYGGSFMISCFILAGFILHASRARYQNYY